MPLNPLIYFPEESISYELDIPFPVVCFINHELSTVLCSIKYDTAIKKPILSLHIVGANFYA